MNRFVSRSLSKSSGVATRLSQRVSVGHGLSSIKHYSLIKPNNGTNITCASSKWNSNNNNNNNLNNNHNNSLFGINTRNFSNSNDNRNNDNRNESKDGKNTNENGQLLEGGVSTVTAKLNDDNMNENENGTEAPPSTKKIFDNLQMWKSKIGQTEFHRLWDFTKPEAKWILRGCAALAISSSVTMSVPVTFGYIIDIATGAKTGISLTQLSAIMSGVFVTGGAFNAYRVYCFSRAGHNVVRRIRSSLFESITKQEIGFFDKVSTGEMVNRLSSDTTIMGESLGGLQLSALLRNTAQMVMSFSVMLYLSPDLTLVMTGLIPIGALGSVFYGRFVKSTQQAVQKALAESTEVAEEKLSNIRTVRSFANEKFEVSNYVSKINNVFDLSMLQTRGSSLFFGTTGVIGNVFLLGVLGYGAHLVQLGTITSGLLTSCLLYSVYVGMSVVSLTSSLSSMMKGIGASTRVFEIMDRQSQIPNDMGTELIHDFVGNVEFKNVKFVYPTRQESVILNNFNLAVKSGQAIAIVGESGVGKSTIISLLLRFYDPIDGSITIDDFDVRDLKPNFIRKHIGVVTQEPVLFTGTIRDNIFYGIENDENKELRMNDNELIKVTKEANAYDFIMDFPKGFDTVLGEGGINLSGGQKQRIAIARALIKNCKILLLDEATSALDATSEHLVADSITKLMKSRTTIVIAHRLSTIKKCDVIAVLKDGQIVELGNHDELINKPNSLYSELVKRQLH